MSGARDSSPAIGLLMLDLFFPDAQSLKGKRSCTLPLMAQLRRDWNVSVAETGDRDAWQRATIAVAAVNTSSGEAHRTLDEIARSIERNHRLQLLDYSIEII